MSYDFQLMSWVGTLLAVFPYIVLTRKFLFKNRGLNALEAVVWLVLMFALIGFSGFWL